MHLGFRLLNKARGLSCCDHVAMNAAMSVRTAHLACESHEFRRLVTFSEVFVVSERLADPNGYCHWRSSTQKISS